jgi:hypothetical protein
MESLISDLSTDISFNPLPESSDPVEAREHPKNDVSFQQLMVDAPFVVQSFAYR